MSPFCPAVVKYRVIFADGTIIYPYFPGNVDPYAVASVNAAARNTSVVSVERI